MACHLPFCSEACLSLGGESGGVSGTLGKENCCGVVLGLMITSIAPFSPVGTTTDCEGAVFGVRERKDVMIAMENVRGL